MPYKNLDKALLFLRNQVFCPKMWKLWWAPTILHFNISCWNFANVFYLLLSKQWCVEFFLFYLDLELFAKIQKDLVSKHSYFTLLLITQGLNKIKKSHTLFCRAKCAKFQQKILKSMVVGARFGAQSFQFFRQKPCFLGNTRGLP